MVEFAGLLWGAVGYFQDPRDFVSGLSANQLKFYKILGAGRSSSLGGFAGHLDFERAQLGTLLSDETAGKKASHQVEGNKHTRSGSEITPGSVGILPRIGWISVRMRRIVFTNCEISSRNREDLRGN